MNITTPLCATSFRVGTLSTCATIFSDKAEQTNIYALAERDLARTHNTDADGIHILNRDSLQTKKDGYCKALRNPFRKNDFLPD